MACGSLCAGRKAEGEVGGVGVAFESEERVFDVKQELWKNVGERAGSGSTEMGAQPLHFSQLE